MMHHKIRILSLLAAALIVLSGCAGSAAADKTDAAAPAAQAGTVIEASGEVTEVDLSAQSGTVLFDRGGVYLLRGTLSDGQLVIEAPKDEKVELILSGVSVTNSAGAAVNCRQAKDLILTLAEGTENTLADAAQYRFDDPDKGEPDAAVFSKADILIRGGGALTVTGSFKHGIASNDDLKIKGGTIRVSSVSDALHGKDSVVIEDGVFTLRAGKDGISATNKKDAEKGYIEIAGGSFDMEVGADGVKAQTDVTITGGDFWIEARDDGVHADRNLQIDGGTFNIPTCYEGMEGTTITINGGTIFIKSTDDAIGAAAGTEEARAFYGRDGNPAVSVTINGGEIEAFSGGDTVDSNGNIFVNGGKLRLSSPATPYYEGVLLCNGRVTVTGGDLAMVGNIGVELTVENQPMLLVSFSSAQPAGSTPSLRDQSGNTLLEIRSRRDYTQAIFSSPELKFGESYAVYVDEQKIVEMTLDGMINKVSNDGGAFTGGYPRGHW